MYVPDSFAETNLNKLHDFIEQHSFATLVSDLDNEPFASHLPLLLDRNQGKKGQLIGHFAKANPQSQTAQHQKMLTIFHGPHTYISPTWYQSSNTVPTWNYLAVHVYGTYCVIDDPEELKDVIERYVTFYEASQPDPWSLQNIDPDFTNQLLKAIVGFRINIERIEGKFKLNQNQSIERQQKVVNVLKQQSNDQSQEIAKLMQSQLSD